MLLSFRVFNNAEVKLGEICKILVFKVGRFVQSYQSVLRNYCMHYSKNKFGEMNPRYNLYDHFIIRATFTFHRFIEEGPFS
jgi:hypothetical protein